MKKKIMSAIACLALVLGAGGLTSCDSEEASGTTLYSISDLLVYDRLAGEFDLTGQQVRLENVIVTSSHGNSITVSEYEGVEAIEVILSEDSPAVTIETLVNVEGTMNTYHGRAQIADAIVQTVDPTQQNFYYTTGFKRSSGFDNYGRTDSGVIGGASQNSDGTMNPIKLRLLSYNGATEYKEGEDLILSVAYQGTDYDDPYNWLELVLFGDSDKDTIAYYNAFFFGTSSAVSWSSPFSTGRADRSIIPAGWAGIAEGEYFACTLLHFYYDEELNPDYGCMFFLDNVCLQYIDSFELYNEQSDLGDDLAAFAAALESGDEDASYTNTITYEYKEGETISLSEYYSMNSTAYNRYLNNLETIDSDNFTVSANKTYFAWEEIYYPDPSDTDYFEYQAEVLYTYDDDGITRTAQLDFEDKETFDSFLSDGSISDYTNIYTYSYDYEWTDLVYSLFDLFSYYNYSRSFKQSNSSYSLNDDALIDYMWDVLDGFFMGFSDDYYDYYGYAFDLQSLTYNSSSKLMKSTYDMGGWYYADSYYSTVLYIDYVVTNSLTLNYTEATR